MEQAGVMRTLAEPTLTAISGESAKFLAGGEFPFVVGWSDTSGYQIEWKPYGVLLNFTPIVLSEGRISLRMATEVSELDTSQTVNFGWNNTNKITGIKTRRASSTLELPSGGSIALAGLIKEETKQGISGLPGLLNLPILGTLFRSRDFKSGQTELMIIVTPYVVNSVARTQLQTPRMAFRRPPIPRPSCSAGSIASTASPGRSTRRGPITAPTASSPIERDRRVSCRVRTRSPGSPPVPPLPPFWRAARPTTWSKAAIQSPMPTVIRSASPRARRSTRS